MYKFYQQYKKFRNEHHLKKKIFTILPHKKIRFFGCLLAEDSQYSLFLAGKGNFIVIKKLDNDLHWYEVWDFDKNVEIKMKPEYFTFGSNIPVFWKIRDKDSVKRTIKYMCGLSNEK